MSQIMRPVTPASRRKPAPARIRILSLTGKTEASPFIASPALRLLPILCAEQAVSLQISCLRYCQVPVPEPFWQLL